MEKYFFNHWIFNFISRQDYSQLYIKLTIIALDIIILTLLLFIINYLVRKKLEKLLHKFIKKTNFTWDDILLKNKVFKYFFNTLFLLVLRVVLQIIFSGIEYIHYVLMILNVAVIVLICQILVRIINSIIEINSLKKEYNNVGLMSFFEFFRIAIYIIFTIILSSYLLDINFSTIITSIGALTAVIILVFRDTILGLVAGIQISLTKIVKIGDWINIPKYNVDGNVTEINLTSSKIRNWDNTISTVPTYSLINSSLKNWEGMTESKVRRIKRSINFNVRSFKFCDKKSIDKFKKYELIAGFLEEKSLQIEEYNKQKNIDKKYYINGRNLTNIGVFRYYVEAYIKDNPNISQEHIIMVRQLQTTPQGMPLEVYCFSKDISWVNYEKIQSDLFDHIITSAKEFDLEIYQSFSDVNQIKL